MKVSSSKLGRARRRGSWGGAGCGVRGAGRWGRRSAGRAGRRGGYGRCSVTAGIDREKRHVAARRPAPHTTGPRPERPRAYYASMLFYYAHYGLRSYHTPDSQLFTLLFAPSVIACDQRISSMILKYCILGPER
ncbi:unnamed protein product, partial [Brenthis ino]